MHAALRIIHKKHAGDIAHLQKNSYLCAFNMSLLFRDLDSIITNKPR